MVWARKEQKTDPSFAAKPDLVILDGGKGQLSAVLSAVKFPKTTTVVALAKREEEIFKMSSRGATPPQRESDAAISSDQQATKRLTKSNGIASSATPSRNDRLEFECVRLPEGMKIRKATSKNIKVAQKIISSNEEFSAEFNPSDEWYVILKEREIIGCCCFIFRSKNHIELSSVWIKEGFRNKGLGSVMIQYVLEKCPQSKLYLISADAIEFYKQLGFQIVSNPPAVLAQELARCNQIWSDPASVARRSVMVREAGNKDDLPSVTQIEFERVQLPKDSPALYLIQRIRDEAHRTANDLRKKIGSKTEKSSALDELPGVGAATKKLLLQKFGSVEQVKKASEAELVDVFGQQKGIKIHRQLVEFG
jgi:N-acetylglutamate synthase-like GNAT family acetyltransferase